MITKLCYTEQLYLNHILVVHTDRCQTVQLLLNIRNLLILTVESFIINICMRYFRPVRSVFQKVGPPYQTYSLFIASRFLFLIIE